MRGRSPYRAAWPVSSQSTLEKFREVVALILKTVHPKMPVDPNTIPNVTFPFDAALIDVLTVKATDIMKKTPLTSYAFPQTIVSANPTLPAAALGELKSVLDLGLQVTSFRRCVYVPERWGRAASRSSIARSCRAPAS